MKERDVPRSQTSFPTDGSSRMNASSRRMPDFPDYFHSWNFLSSIGSGITFLSKAKEKRKQNKKRKRTIS